MKLLSKKPRKRDQQQNHTSYPVRITIDGFKHDSIVYSVSNLVIPDHEKTYFTVIVFGTKSFSKVPRPEFCRTICYFYIFARRSYKSMTIWK